MRPRPYHITDLAGPLGSTVRQHRPARLRARALLNATLLSLPLWALALLIWSRL